MFGSTFEPAGGGGFFIIAMHGMAQTVPAASTYALNPYLDGVNATSFGFFVTRPCTIRNLYFRKSGTQPAGGLLRVTAMVNAVATLIEVVVPAGDAGNNNFSDLVDTVQMQPGDNVYVRLINNAGAASCGIRACSLDCEV